MSKNTKEKNSTNLEELICEMSECREDERSAQNQMIQVIATAGAILTFIFSASSFTEKNKSMLFNMSNLILCTAIGYITSLGMSNVLRYHYLQNLEDRLSKLNAKVNNKDELIHWMSFSSPITTRNPLHLNLKYTSMHYVCYAIATICPILFCAVITIFQFVSLDTYTIIDMVSIAILTLCCIASGFVFFISSIKAKKMYDFALKNAMMKKKKRTSGINKRTSPKKFSGIFQVIGYFIYPKKKDIQKLFIIVWGYFTGILFSKGTFLISFEQIYLLIVACFIIDFLIYQARYLWNDIRGLGEDISSGKKDRLPVKILGVKLAINLSLLIISIRIIAAFIILEIFDFKVNFIFLIFSLLIIFSSILYEVARSIKSTQLIFCIVSLGYAIRFSSGLWIAYPEIWNIGIIFEERFISRFIIVLLIVSYAFLGEFSVVLPWIHETLIQIKTGKKIVKNHYLYLYNKVRTSCDERLDFRHCVNSSIFNLWDCSFVISIILLSITNMLIHYTLLVLIEEVVTLFLTFKLCKLSYNKKNTYLIIMLSCLLFKITLSFNVLTMYCYCTQLIYVIIFFVLRYIFDPSFDFVLLCKDLIYSLYFTIIGGASVYIKSNNIICPNCGGTDLHAEDIRCNVNRAHSMKCVTCKACGWVGNETELLH